MNPNLAPAPAPTPAPALVPAPAPALVPAPVVAHTALVPLSQLMGQPLPTIFEPARSPLGLTSHLATAPLQLDLAGQPARRLDLAPLIAGSATDALSPSLCTPTLHVETSILVVPQVATLASSGGERQIWPALRTT